MLMSRLPEFIRTHYECHEWKHASAILNLNFPSEWNDLLDLLTAFRWRSCGCLRGRSWCGTLRGFACRLMHQGGARGLVQQPVCLPRM